LSSGQRAGELAVSLKSAWVVHRGLVSSALSNPATRNFFASVVTAADRPVSAVATSLKTRGKVTALEVVFDCKGRRAVHLIVYALKFERASVGQLLIEQSVRTAMRDSLAT
jgi:CelD/BcsL family acetyltransferase involved in cellulose biosynthesis